MYDIKSLTMQQWVRSVSLFLFLFFIFLSFLFLKYSECTFSFMWCISVSSTADWTCVPSMLYYTSFLFFISFMFRDFKFLIFIFLGFVKLTRWEILYHVLRFSWSVHFFSLINIYGLKDPWIEIKPQSVFFSIQISVFFFLLKLCNNYFFLFAFLEISIIFY